MSVYCSGAPTDQGYSLLDAEALHERGEGIAQPIEDQVDGDADRDGYWIPAEFVLQGHHQDARCGSKPCRGE